MSLQLPDDDSKPWYSDPTFLLAAVPTILGVLKILGYLPDADVDTVNQLISDTVKNGFLFGASAIGLWKYFTKEQAVAVERMALRREMVMEKYRMELRQSIQDKPDPRENVR